MDKRTPSKRNEKKLNPTLKVFLKTQMIAAISYLSVFLVSSIVCLSLDLKKNTMFYVSVLSFAAASFLCAYYAGYKIHKNGLVVGLLYALPTNILVIIISVIVNGFKIDLTGIISFFILIISSMLAGVLSVNTKLKSKRK